MTATLPVTEEYLDGTGGRILTRHWEPDSTPKANLVICHGVNSHGGQYIGAGEEFASRGYAVTALDLRGRGKSDGERFYIESIDDYVSDVSLTIERARAKHPDLPIFLLGHSAGGVTSTTYALDHQDLSTGSSARASPSAFSRPDFALTLLKGAQPRAAARPVFKLKMEDFSRDPEWVAQLDADPLTLDEVQPVANCRRFRARRRTVRARIREDHACRCSSCTGPRTRRRVRMAASSSSTRRGSADKTLKLYEGHYHDMLNDLGREVVFEDIDAWISERLPAKQEVAQSPSVLA